MARVRATLVRAALAGVTLLSVCTLLGCAHAARDTTGFAMSDQVTVEAPFEQTWESTKAVLRERQFDIFTRDKRGRFVAFTAEERNWQLVPKRTKLTISLEPESASSTRMHIETVDQEFGVTLFTYPGWHDRATSDDSAAQAVIEGVRAHVNPA